jgi:hypothetical protein
MSRYLRRLAPSKTGKFRSNSLWTLRMRCPPNLITSGPIQFEMTLGEKLVYIATGKCVPISSDYRHSAAVCVDPAKPQRPANNLSLGCWNSLSYVVEFLSQTTTEQLGRTWHHRAQYGVCLCIKGIGPPDYTF